ncbi:DUF3095 domain-containing protein [Microvirga flavescens]|uniref:DUF3095 domain-containing protein n=1 Tax=Microvirga flavescens TaxID=2249811 RepID=UPI000DD93428|nr:DUF3095 domain-containing protein [Microvirga flavescens]
MTAATITRAKAGGTGFYGALPVFDRFARLTDPSIYAPLPDDWVIGLSDIVRSTEAIAAGRYKVVNTAAAAVIVAVANALKDSDFPFVFGGDGASFALPPEKAGLAREILARIAAWVRDDFGLDLRVALVTVAALRSEGADIRVARFAASPDVSYAMFTGGGLALAERKMKAGAFAVPPGPHGARPDLTGLSCRFDEIRAQRGVILSVIVVPATKDEAAFERTIEDVLALAENGAEAARPYPSHIPAFRWPPVGFEIEAKTQGASSFIGRALLLLRIFASMAVFKLGVKIGAFDPARYRRQLVDNTDFRKFDDGLRMTLDCTPRLADRLEDLLTKAERQGIVRFGLHRQATALMTCFVPSATRSDHIHFVDGAMGGYAAAAQALKEKFH